MEPGHVRFTQNEQVTVPEAAIQYLFGDDP